MRLAMADVPIEVRAEAAWKSIWAGADPYAALHAVIWPEGIPSFRTDPGAVQHGDNKTKILCKRGHALEGRNLHISPEGWRRCRTCAREWRRDRRRRAA